MTDWKTDPIKKFGDVSSPNERAKRTLAPKVGWTQPETTEELTVRRQADEKFRIKRTK